MSQAVEIHRIQNSEWREYKQVRMSALSDAPDAFGSTMQRSLSLSDEDWRARLVTASPDLDLPLFAKAQKKIAGLAWGKIFEEDLSTAHLFQMWVAPSVRGVGAGRKLLEAVVRWATSQRTNRILLSVTIDDSPAWHLYQSAGFQELGLPEPLREGSEVMAQPMVLGIRP